MSKRSLKKKRDFEKIEKYYIDVVRIAKIVYIVKIVRIMISL